MGKTRLAIEAARPVRSESPSWSGIWFVDLVPADDAASVGAAVAGAVPESNPANAPGSPNANGIDRVVQTIDETSALLVLDNCEHVVDDVAKAVSRLTASCPNLWVLATSREPLGVAGETCWSVPSLGLPRTTDNETAQLETSAMRLLVERATSRGATVDIPRDLPGLGAICMALDGMPLALELAASAIPRFGISAVADHLDDRLTFLAGDRLQTPRHRTLAATLDWSWDLLEPAERTALAAASTFVAGFDLAAAAPVIGAAVTAEGRGGADSGMGLLGSLVEKSLATIDTGSDPPVYRLLQTVRDYARRKFAALDDQTASCVTAAYMQHYRDRVATLAPQLTHPDRGGAVRAIDLIAAEVRTVIERLLEDGRFLDALVMLADTAWWWVHGRHHEGADLCVRAVAGVGDGTPADGGTLGRALHWAAFLTHDIYPDLTVSWSRRALILLDEAGEKHLAALARLSLGYNLVLQSEFGTAEELISGARYALATSGDDWGVGMAGIIAADLAMRRGDLDHALEVADPALSALRASGDVWSTEQLMSRLSAIAERQGDYETAMTHAEDARQMAWDAAIWESSSFQRARLGILAYTSGDSAAAAGHLTALIADPAEHPTRESLVLAHAGLAATATDPRTSDHHRRQARALLAGITKTSHLEPSLATLGWHD